jgi:hypothetical protein
MNVQGGVYNMAAHFINCHTDKHENMLDSVRNIMWKKTGSKPKPPHVRMRNVSTRKQKKHKTHTRLSTILYSIPQDIEATDPAQVTASGQRGAGVVSQVTGSTVAMDHEVGMIQCLVCQQIFR